jgi:hypothetical protein
MPKTLYYVIFVRGDVEPEVLGPWHNKGNRENVAFALRRKHGLGHGIYPAQVVDGRLTVGSYPSSFFKQEG